MEAIFWLAAVIVLIVIEIATLGLTTIWFAGGALVACIAALFHANLLVQILLFLGVSILLLVFTRPAAVRYLNTNRTKTNAESLVGKDAIVTQEIDNLKAQGQVQVNGLEWTARTEKNQEAIEQGVIVEIEKIDGVKLIVRRKEG
ncbi:MAG: NfeD family protein [Clostridiales bacterium]|nr:NfeD family protein [Clostridiales bacterium]